MWKTTSCWYQSLVQPAEPNAVVFRFRLPPATKAPRGRPSPRRRAEENGKKEAETGGSG